VLVLAVEDPDGVLRATERTEFAEEPGGIVVTNGRSGVHNTAEHANAHIARHIAATLEVWGWLEIGRRKRPV
jgi:hypothetical protein